MDSAESKVDPTPQGATATPVDAPPHSATPLIVTVVVAVLVGAGGLTFTMLNTRATAATMATRNSADGRRGRPCRPRPPSPRFRRRSGATRMRTAG